MHASALCYLNSSNSNAAADAEVASWAAGPNNNIVARAVETPRFYIRVPGCRFWCVPIRAVDGQSIETYCNGRSPQRDPVEVATEPSIWDRCSPCELAADAMLRGVKSKEGRAQEMAPIHSMLHMSNYYSPSSPRIKPGDSVLFDIRLHHGPMLFRCLRISRLVDISNAWKPIMNAVDSWRVDDVTLDGLHVALTDGSVDPPCVAERVTLRVTNIGEDPAYFYGYWILNAA
jgi:hypothetical protein